MIDDCVVNIEDIKLNNDNFNNNIENNNIDYNDNNNNKKVIVFTGSTDGIGRSTLDVLVKNNSKELKFILPVRNIEKGERVKDELKLLNQDADITIMKMDLGSFESIRGFVREFTQLEIPLDILVNNAGLMATSYSTTIDGYETTFAVNHLGPFLLTNLLIDKLKQSVHGGNIVLVTSVMHEREKLDFDQLNVKKSNYSYVSAYGKSKLCNVLFARELQKRLDEENPHNRVKVNYLHPGSAKTSLSRDYGFFVKNIILPIILFFISNPLNEMANSLAALSLNKNNEKGKYFFINKEKSPSGFASDFNNSKRLYDESLKLVQL
ncbi:hypothetical protein DICPUDRAFT_34999 [Dictyostelium purpureum]|uniref:Uncharacterized protein n=1 Tax=Dictyostelium purpureum TaxID=5786 RepID=F0ZNP3_DICPU|nr:uncharacterized protein DICPUDRAFT_34999 [Dictyostelium purpureum]EGC34444.1 hypothetical protein DICPUDRAFT_34999 [Dictyostelium purpureum]|eukprot:XP_003289029.1 hypothetical protein DICPUDRAFT_34999 [Dictyostelium purpureum]